MMLQEVEKETASHGLCEAVVCFALGKTVWAQ